MSNLPSQSQRFESEAEQALIRAGWEPGRVIFDEALNRWLVVEWPTEPNYHFQSRMFPAAYRILREFGGLTIKLQQNRVGRWESRSLIFDPLLAIERTQAYNWPFYEWQAGGSLYPIGFEDTGDTDQSAIAVDGKGQIILVEFEVLLGSNIEAAIHNFFYRVPCKEWKVEQQQTSEAVQIIPAVRKLLGLT